MRKPLQDAFAFRGTLSRRANLSVSLGSSVVVLLAWQVASWCGLLDPTFLPSPIAIAVTLWQMTVAGQIIGNALISLGRILAAFAGQPWAMQPEKLEAVSAFLMFKARGGTLTADEVQARISDRRADQTRE